MPGFFARAGQAMKRTLQPVVALFVFLARYDARHSVRTGQPTQRGRAQAGPTVDALPIRNSTLFRLQGCCLTAARGIMLLWQALLFSESGATGTWLRGFRRSIRRSTAQRTVHYSQVRRSVTVSLPLPSPLSERTPDGANGHKLLGRYFIPVTTAFRSCLVRSYETFMVAWMLTSP